MAEPDYHQQGTDLPKGSASQLDESLDVASAAPEAAAAPDRVATEPSVADGIDQSEMPDLGTGVAANNEIDDEIFGSDTLFPNRPLTHGVPVGPGQNFTVTPRMTDRQILSQAATAFLENRNDIPAEASLWAARVMAGE